MKILGWFRYWPVRAVSGIVAYGLFLSWFVPKFLCIDSGCNEDPRFQLVPIILGPVLVIAFVVLPYTFFWEEHVSPRLKRFEKKNWPDGPEE